MTLILTINAGSSSLKFSAYDAIDAARLCSGQVECLGHDARLIVNHDGQETLHDIGQADHAIALQKVIDTLQDLLGARPVAAVGHRIVHGGPDRKQAVVLTEQVMADLAQFEPFAPLHQPQNLSCVRAAQATFPDAMQIGCFDTAFHRGHPWVNDTFALPRKFYEQGVRRYGFHGLSYDYITRTMIAEHAELVRGRVIVAHLGNGASMCAIKNGQSVGSTMGFSALDGLPMGTRCGQIDPGVLLYMMDQQEMTAEEITTLLYEQSGLLGLSGITSDMRSLQASAAPEAAQAIDYYVFRIARELGAMTAVLGGIDALVFTGGIGENSAYIRERATARLGYLGVKLDDAANLRNDRVISAGDVQVMVIPTDEESVIARACLPFLQT